MYGVTRNCLTSTDSIMRSVVSNAADNARAMIVCNKQALKVMKGYNTDLITAHCIINKEILAIVRLRMK